MLTVPEALAKLESEGNPLSLALFLENNACYGLPGTTHACPVAVYVSSVTDRRYVYVSGAHVLVRDQEYSSIECFPTPQVVRDLVNQFDRGDHPELNAWIRYNT